MVSRTIALFLRSSIFMKKILISAFVLLLFSAAKAQTSTDIKTDATTDPLAMKELVHDFGSIPQGKPVYYFFEITNTGAVPLKLENVQASCGCTTPEWNRDPIAAGGSDKIKVGFNAASEGPFEKFITITYNGNQTKQIRIRGSVWRAPAGSAPSNPSVQFLKQQIQ